MSYTITTPTGEQMTFTTMDALRFWVAEQPLVYSNAAFQSAIARVNMLLHYLSQPETAVEAIRLLQPVPELRSQGMRSVLKELVLRRAAQKGLPRPAEG